MKKTSLASKVAKVAQEKNKEVLEPRRSARLSKSTSGIDIKAKLDEKLQEAEFQEKDEVKVKHKKHSLDDLVTKKADVNKGKAAAIVDKTKFVDISH